MIFGCMFETRIGCVWALKNESDMFYLNNNYSQSVHTSSASVMTEYEESFHSTVSSNNIHYIYTYINIYTSIYVYIYSACVPTHICETLPGNDFTYFLWITHDGPYI